MSAKSACLYRCATATRSLGPWPDCAHDPDSIEGVGLLKHVPRLGNRRVMRPILRERRVCVLMFVYAETAQTQAHRHTGTQAHRRTGTQAHCTLHTDTHRHTLTPPHTHTLTVRYITARRCSVEHTTTAAAVTTAATAAAALTTTTHSAPRPAELQQSAAEISKRDAAVGFTK